MTGLKILIFCHQLCCLEPELVANVQLRFRLQLKGRSQTTDFHPELVGFYIFLEDKKLYMYTSLKLLPQTIPAEHVPPFSY